MGFQFFFIFLKRAFLDLAVKLQNTTQKNLGETRKVVAEDESLNLGKEFRGLRSVSQSGFKKDVRYIIGIKTPEASRDLNCYC